MRLRQGIASRLPTSGLCLERNFLHRYRLSFFDQDGYAHEAMTPLPSDLVQALASLVPRTTESAVALREWMSGAALRDWAKFALLGDANR